MSRSRRTSHDLNLAAPQLTGGQIEAFLTPKEAADYLRVSKSYLDKLRVYGGGPKFLRFGKRKVLYCKSDLDLWATERRYGSTSEYPTPSQDQWESISNIRKINASNTLSNSED
jgi:excisionase family DNA binding protein